MIQEFNYFKDFINDKINEIGATQFFRNLNDKDYFDSYSKELIKIAAEEVKLFIKPSKIDTIEDLAKLLDNNQYGEEFKNEFNFDIEKICEENKWLIAYPESDDLLEIRGIRDSEFGAWNGTTIKFYRKGSFYLFNKTYDTYKKALNDDFYQDESIKLDNCDKLNDIVIESIFSPDIKTDASWLLKCNIPEDKGSYSTFTIMEDDEVFGNGVILDLSKVL